MISFYLLLFIIPLSGPYAWSSLYFVCCWPFARWKLSFRLYVRMFVCAGDKKLLLFEIWNGSAEQTEGRRISLIQAQPHHIHTQTNRPTGQKKNLEKLELQLQRRIFNFLKKFFSCPKDGKVVEQSWWKVIKKKSVWKAFLLRVLKISAILWTLFGHPMENRNRVKFIDSEDNIFKTKNILFFLFLFYNFSSSQLNNFWVFRLILICLVIFLLLFPLSRIFLLSLFLRHDNLKYFYGSFKNWRHYHLNFSFHFSQLFRTISECHFLHLPARHKH